MYTYKWPLIALIASEWVRGIGFGYLARLKSALGFVNGAHEVRELLRVFFPRIQRSVYNEQHWVYFRFTASNRTHLGALETRLLDPRIVYC